MGVCVMNLCRCLEAEKSHERKNAIEHTQNNQQAEIETKTIQHIPLHTVHGLRTRHIIRPRHIRKQRDDALCTPARKAQVKEHTGRTPRVFDVRDARSEARRKRECNACDDGDDGGDVRARDEGHDIADTVGGECDAPDDVKPLAEVGCVARQGVEQSQHGECVTRDVQQVVHALGDEGSDDRAAILLVTQKDGLVFAEGCDGVGVLLCVFENVLCEKKIN